MLRVATGFAHLTMRSATRRLRAIANSRVERQAFSLARDFPKGKFSIADADGYTKFSAADIGLTEKIAAISRLAQIWKKEPDRSNSDKPFLRNMMRSQDLLEHPEILDVALHAEFLGPISHYLGQMPRLVNLEVWWTPPNQTAVRSQLFHYDHRDMRQSKIFLNLNDVGETAGPLHFVPAAVSARVNRTVGYSQDRYTDEEVYLGCSKDEVVRTIGPAGSVFIVDTARCLHYGSRENIEDRLVLMASFARANCVDEGPGCEVLDPIRIRLGKERYGNDPSRSFILTANF